MDCGDDILSFFDKRKYAFLLTPRMFSSIQIAMQVLCQISEVLFSLVPEYFFVLLLYLTAQNRSV